MTLNQLKARANTKLQTYAKSIQAATGSEGISEVEAILYANFKKQALVDLAASIQQLPNQNPVRYRIQFHIKTNSFFLDYDGLEASTSLWTLTTDMQYNNPVLANLDPKDPYFDSQVILAISAVYDPL